MNYLLPARLDRLAREYALGTLSGPARRRFEGVLRSSPTARRAVELWVQRLAILDLSLAPTPAPRTSWSSLERRLFGAPARARRPGAWWRLFSKRTFAGALAGIVIGVAVLHRYPTLIGLEPTIDTLPASYVGLLLDRDGRPAIVASSRRQGRLLTLKFLRPLVVPAGSTAKLWALPADGSAPFAVGTISESGNRAFALADTSEKLFSKVSRLAVSYEPAASRDDDRPSRPFDLIGFCVKVW